MIPPIFQIEDFPRMEQEKSGYSLYRGILVKWDEDYDQMILAFIDQLPADERKQLVMAQEHENCLSLVWKGTVPFKLMTGKYYKQFLIYDSRSIGNPALDYWNQFPKPNEYIDQSY